MTPKRLLAVVATLFIVPACIDDDPPTVVVPEPDASNNAATDAGDPADAEADADVPPDTDAGSADAGDSADVGDPFTGFGEFDDVVVREQCTVGSDAIYVTTAIDASFPAEAAINEDSVYAVGSAPALYAMEDVAFSVAWVNTSGSNVHAVGATAVVSEGITTLESQVYFTFNAGPGVEVTAMDLRPAPAETGTDPLYQLTLYSSEGVYVCTARQSQTDMSITQMCEPNQALNDYLNAQSLSPVRAFTSQPILGDNYNFNPLAGRFVSAGNGGTEGFRLGAVRTDFFVFPNNLAFPDIVALQATPFFEHLVLGADERANRAPYLLALVGEGPSAQPTILAVNEGITEYQTVNDEWPFFPEFEASPGGFAFVSSIDPLLEQGLGTRFDPVATDVFFGYLGVLADGSLGFSRPDGFGADDFVRWAPPEAVERVWAFDNLALQQSPGESLVFARSATGKLLIFRWDVDRSLEVIPDALSGSGVETVLDVRGIALREHSGVFALKVQRGGEPDLAILPLESIRDFTDRMCN